MPTAPLLRRSSALSVNGLIYIRGQRARPGARGPAGVEAAALVQPYQNESEKIEQSWKLGMVYRKVLPA